MDIIIILFVVISLAILYYINIKRLEKFQGKCQFSAWGPSKRGCIDRCRNDRDMWGGEACTLSKCYNICNSCSSVTNCNWLNQREFLENPNKEQRTQEKPLKIRGIAGNEKCIIEWIAGDEDIRYMLKFYESARPNSGVKVEYLDLEKIGGGSNQHNQKIITNLYNNIEYSFIIVPIKENDKLKPSNILRLIPNENVALEYAN